MSALTRTLFEQIGAFPGALIVFTDWPTYYPDEMAIMNSLRFAGLLTVVGLGTTIAILVRRSRTILPAVSPAADYAQRI